MDGRAFEPTESRACARTIPLLWLVCLGAVIAGMFLIRGLSPGDLLDNDQLKPAGYVLDTVLNNRWLVQRDFFGNIASKPPLHTWIAAFAWLVIGPSVWALALPSLIGMVLGCVAIWMIAARALGERAAMAGCLAWLVSFFGFKHVWLARTDALYAGLTAMAVALAWRACRDGRDGKWASGVRSLVGPWVWVWLVLALGTLTKGPICIVLVGFAAIGLAMKTPAQRMRGGHIVGAMVLLLLAGGWFAAALMFDGQGVYDKLIGDELVGHAVGANKGHLKEITLSERAAVFCKGLFKPTLYAIWNTLPWCVAWLIGMWRVVCRPSRDAAERRLELMCLAWFGLGIAVFSVVPHQRSDHVLPLVPAAAILAGREIARWTQGWSAARCCAAVAGVMVIGLTLGVVNYSVLQNDKWYVKHQRMLEGLARELRDQPGVDLGRIVFVDASAGLQFMLTNRVDRVSVEEAAASLAAGESTLFAVRDVRLLRERFVSLGGEPSQLRVIGYAKLPGSRPSQTNGRADADHATAGVDAGQASDPLLGVGEVLAMIVGRAPEAAEQDEHDEEVVE